MGASQTFATVPRDGPSSLWPASADKLPIVAMHGTREEVGLFLRYALAAARRMPAAIPWSGTHGRRPIERPVCSRRLPVVPGSSQRRAWTETPNETDRRAGPAEVKRASDQALVVLDPNIDPQFKRSPVQRAPLFLFYQSSSRAAARTGRAGWKTSRASRAGGRTVSRRATRAATERQQPQELVQSEGELVSKTGCAGARACCCCCCCFRRKTTRAAFLPAERPRSEPTEAFCPGPRRPLRSTGATAGLTVDLCRQAHSRAVGRAQPSGRAVAASCQRAEFADPRLMHTHTRPSQTWIKGRRCGETVPFFPIQTSTTRPLAGLSSPCARQPSPEPRALELPRDKPIPSCPHPQSAPPPPSSGPTLARRHGSLRPRARV